MSTELLEALAASVGAASRGTWSLVIGALVGSDATGAPLVDWAGNDGVPRVARWIDGAWTGPVPSNGRVVPAVLLVSASGGDAPVLAGCVRDALPKDPTPDRVEIETRRSGARVVLDDKRLELEAREEIVLRCGEGSIRLSKDGTVVIKGRRLLSRSAEANVIRGATVKIN